MKTFFAILFCATFVLTGCHFSNTAHYRVVGVETGSRNADKIRSILRTAARKTGMTNEISNTLVPDTLACYGGGEKYPIILGAYFCKGDVLIDLQGQYGPHMPNFESAQHHLVPALTKAFGADFVTLGKHPTNDCGPGFSVDSLSNR